MKTDLKTEATLLIVTTYAPQAVERETFRGRIFKSFLTQISMLVNDKIKAVLIGPYFQTEYSNLTFYFTDLPNKEAKLDWVYHKLREEKLEFNFICRLDDDDFINPQVFSYLNTEYNFITDKLHTFYDIATDMESRQQRPWYPNTTLMSWNIAFSEPWQKGKSVFFHYDHSKAWHKYAAEFSSRIYFSDAPVYWRLLSPFSITSSNNRSGIESDLKINWSEYFRYRSNFGKWERNFPITSLPREKLKEIAIQSFGELLKPNWMDTVQIKFSRVLIKLGLKR